MAQKKKRGISLESACFFVILAWVISAVAYGLIAQNTSLIGHTKTGLVMPNKLITPVINEVELDPKTDTPNDDAGQQWVELYNPSFKPISLKDYHLNFTSKGGSPDENKLSGIISPRSVKSFTIIGLSEKTGKILLVERSDPEDPTTDEFRDEFTGSDEYNDARTWQRFPDGNYPVNGNEEEFQFLSGSKNIHNGDFTSAFWISFIILLGWPFVFLFLIAIRNGKTPIEGLGRLLRENAGSVNRASSLEAKMDKKRVAASKKAITFIDWDLTPGEVEYIAYLLAIVSTTFILVMGMILSITFALNGVSIPTDLYLITLPIGGILVFILTYNGVSHSPISKANLLRTRAMGKMGEVIYYMTISMSLNPSIEKAIAFAANNTDPPLSTGLKKVLWRVHTRKYDTVDASLLAFADDWGEWNTDFKRSLYGVVAAQGERTKEGMRYALQRATDIILDGTKAKLQSYAAKLSGPTMVLFSMGILLPLIIGSTLPMVAMAGIQMTTVHVVLLIDVLFPTVAFLYANSILRNRPEPMSIPLIKMTFNKNSFSKSLITGILVGIFIGSLVFLLGDLITQGTLNAIGVAYACGAASGFGAFLLFFEKERIAIRRRVQDLENAFPDAVYLMGSYIGEGIPLEVAFKKVADGLQKGEITKELNRWSFISTMKRIPPEEALHGPNGLLRDHPSRVVSSTMRMVTGSIQKDPTTASRTVIGISGYLRDLKQVENDVRTSLMNNVSMMFGTALFFAPLVLGISVAMYKILQGALSGLTVSSDTSLGSLNLSGGGSIPLGDYGAIMGIYLALTAIIVAHFCSGILTGDDNVERRYTIGQILPVSMTVFGLVFVFAQTLFPG